MPNYTLQPGDQRAFTDTEGGSDLVIKNETDSPGSYTISNDDGPAHAHTLQPHSHALYEVAYHQTATVTNTGNVALEADFADDASGRRHEHHHEQ